MLNVVDEEEGEMPMIRFT